MSTKSFPKDVIEQGRAVPEAWRSIDPAFKVDDLAAEALEADLNQVALIGAKLDRLDAETSEARNQRDAFCQGIWDKVKRLRRGVQAIYGDDPSTSSGQARRSIKWWAARASATASPSRARLPLLRPPLPRPQAHDPAPTSMISSPKTKRPA